MIDLNSILYKGRNREGRPRIRGMAVGFLAASIFILGACESLLEVDLPGQLRDTDLNDPALASVLAKSVQADFDCALGRYVHAGGVYGNDLYVTTTDSRLRLTQLRSREMEIFDQLECDQGPYPPILLPFQIVRGTAEDYIKRINDFEEAPADKDFLVGKLNAYAGYAYQILGETFCELTFDGGPIVSRAATMALAEARFTAAISGLGALSSADATYYKNMALVGRARSRLNQGNGAGAVADAKLVDAGFVALAEMDAGESRRWNRIYDTVTDDQNETVHPDYIGLKVGTVDDPRIPLKHVGLGVGRDGISDMWTQHKYDDLGADIPFATYREAQLMIAEVQQGQEAVTIINALRASVADLPHVASDHASLPLPAFASTDAAAIKAQVWEERRRELFLQGTKVGDILRLDIPGVTTDDFETGTNQRGMEYGPHTCMPLPDVEKLQNPNI